MPRHPSIMLTLAHGARNRPGVRDEAVAMLRAAGKVEQQFGTNKAVDALLSAYVSTVTTLAVNGAMDPDAPIVLLTDMLDQVTAIRDALRAGSPLPNTTIVGAVAVPPDVSAAWGKRPEGRA